MKTEKQFAEIYADPDAKMATAEDLLDSMSTAGVDISVACGFWWSDASLAQEHTNYLIEVEKESQDASFSRIIPFVPIQTSDPPDFALGVGELRKNQRTDLGLVTDLRGVVLVHVSEEVGHQYPGKSGGLSVRELWLLLINNPNLRVIAAHWGGGLPFYGLMPEVQTLIKSGRIVFDSAASKYLYTADIYKLMPTLVGDSSICWGSDFPLRSQLNDLRDVKSSLFGTAYIEKFIGENAMKFLKINPKVCV
tara:strand:- start:1015 stop:1764 length:750 start_codon:yes stop_codon:yes gene_type:complete